MFTRNFGPRICKRKKPGSDIIYFESFYWQGLCTSTLFWKIWMICTRQQYSSNFSQRKLWSRKSILNKVAYLHQPYLNKNRTCFREFYEISLLELLVLTQSLTQKKNVLLSFSLHAKIKTFFTFGTCKTRNERIHWQITPWFKKRPIKKRL